LVLFTLAVTNDYNSQEHFSIFMIRNKVYNVHEEEDTMQSDKITTIKWALLKGRRPRNAGCNARLGVHGQTVDVPLMCITTEDGMCGYGISWASRETSQALQGKRMRDIFHPGEGVTTAYIPWEYPLLDIQGKRLDMPVYALAAEYVGHDTPSNLKVHCYDTSLDIDDLGIQQDDQAADYIAEEAREGYSKGHRAFKIKVGRGAMHMLLEDGMRRDIAVVHAVRKAVGNDADIMLDANNGWNYNLTCRALEETADCRIFWMEEAFHEDPVLYGVLKQWMKKRDLTVLIADGEGQASPSLLDWANERIVDVVQYDIFSHGFQRWLRTGQILDAHGVRSAPHHYGGHLGNYYSCHLAGAVRGLCFVEWDEVETAGIDDSGYSITEGWVHVPSVPGFGLNIDEVYYEAEVKRTGWTL
jgi:L-alanine-DL-glutamate epimerase-like enolase superfamily enzyme